MDRDKKDTDWNTAALKMIPVLIFLLAGIMYLFNVNSEEVYVAYYNITNQTNPHAGEEGGMIFLPHHILLILITAGILVVIAFAVYILSCIDEDENYHSDTYTDTDF